jgi:hypothetical protein
LEPIVKDLEKAKEMTSDYKDYISKVREVYFRHCETDQNGNLKFYADPSDESTLLHGNATNGNVKVLDDDHAALMTSELEALKVEHEAVISYQQGLFDGYNSALNDKIDVNIHQISFDEFSSMGSISYRQISVLEIMLEGSEDYEDDVVEEAEVVQD